MESNPKIIVLQLKEIIYTLIFIILGILLLVLLIYVFLPKDKDKESSGAIYNAGTYSSAIDVGNTILDITVTVDSNYIKDIAISNLSEDIETMYPLLQDSLDYISSQIIKTQSTDNIYCSNDNKYTCTVLLTAINHALDKGRINSY